MPAISVSSSVSRIAGRSWRRIASRPFSTCGSSAASIGVGSGSDVFVSISVLLMFGTAFSNAPLLRCQVEQREQDVYQLDAQERQDDAANAVEQQIAPQQRRRSNRAILDAA